MLAEEQQSSPPAIPFAKLLGYLPILLLALVGAAVVWIGSGYRTGTLTAMGPGFMPVLLGAALLLASLLLWWRAAPQNIGALPWRPLVCVTAGMLAWVLLADRVGFFAAALVQILLSSFAVPQRERRQELGVAVLLSIGAYFLFVRVLGLPLPAFGG
jgi:hypothetical protein